MKDCHTNYYWQKTKIKIRNAFTNNIWKDINLNKAQLSKTIQSGKFLGALLNKLAGPSMKVIAPLAKNILTPLTWHLPLK